MSKILVETSLRSWMVVGSSCVVGVICPLIKGQLISKANFEVFISTKNEQKCFSISALAS